MVVNKKWRKLIRDAVDIRRELHKIPEPCWEEHRTTSMIRKRLDQLGIRWRECAKTGVVAQIAQHASGRHMAFRSDMDGLVMEETGEPLWKSIIDGCMHSCGHDGHMATMLAAAEWLHRQEAILAGPVSFLFQPAEEGGFGAREMIADGALEGIDAIFGWHNWPTIPLGAATCPPGSVMAANAGFTIVLQGQGGHASQPEMCRDPVVAAAALVTALQHIVSRTLPPQQAGVVSVTSIDARSGETTIPERAVLRGSVRVVDSVTLQKIGDRIEAISLSISSVYGVKAKVEFSPRYPAVVNNSVEVEQVQQALSYVFGADWEDTEILLPIMASEDFSYYLEQLPGAFALMGSGSRVNSPLPCHNSGYDFNDLLIEPMVQVIVRLAGLYALDVPQQKWQRN
jgi:amidohydrolase